MTLTDISTPLMKGVEGSQGEYWEWFESNLRRQSAASLLVDAVLRCAPEDRCQFLEMILDEIRPGWPQGYYADLMAEAGWWANNATRMERKAYLFACWQRLTPQDQTAFLTYVNGGQAA